MKKTKLIILSLLAIFAFASCDGGETSSQSEETPYSETVSSEEIISINNSSEEVISIESEQVSDEEKSENEPISEENTSLETSINNPTSETVDGEINKGEYGEGDIIDWIN